MQIGQLVLVRTDPATQFVDAIGQNVMAELTMQLPVGPQVAGLGFVPGGLAAGGATRARIRSVGIVSVESLDWTVWLWGNDTFSDANPELERFLGHVSLPASGAKRPANGSGLYHYFQSGLDIPLEDLAGLGQIYLGLQPTSAGKSAGAGGSVMVILAAEPTCGC